MSTRRQFLGQVIGTVVAIPFIAQEVIKADTIFPEKKNALENFKFAVTTDSGHTIWAPKVESIIFDKDKNSLNISAQPLLIDKPFTIVGIHVFGPEGQQISNGFCSPRYLSTGDILKMSYSLTFSGLEYLPKPFDPLDYDTWKEQFKNKFGGYTQGDSI